MVMDTPVQAMESEDTMMVGSGTMLQTVGIFFKQGTKKKAVATRSATAWCAPTTKKSGHKEKDCWTKQREKSGSGGRELHQVNMLREEKDVNDIVTPELVAAVCCGNDGKPLPKKRELRKED